MLIRTPASLQLGHLKRHQDSEAHRLAVKHLSSKQGAKLAFDLRGAPPVSEFKLVWQAAKDGTSTQRVASVGTQKKITRMRWCLAEGCRIVWRAFLKGAQTIAFHQDKRKSKLGTRFTAADASLRRMGGLLGLQTCHGGAKELVDATVEMITTFCTPGAGRPKSELEPLP